MRSPTKFALIALLAVAWPGYGFVLPAISQTAVPPVATIRRVAVLNHGANFELEIEASQAITPQTQVVTGPDRLVVDFPNSVPGNTLRPLAVNAGEVKGVRAGLFESNPPVTRVVLDLKSPQRYEIFPSGRTVIVKLLSAGAPVAALPSPPTVASEPAVAAPAPVKPAPRLQVDFTNGKLRIVSDRASMADILREVQRTTGATVSIPPGADQQPVIADLGPGAARDVLSALLSGSPYNVVLLGSGRDLSLVTSIILTARGPEGSDLPANFSPTPVANAATEAQPEPPPPVPDTPPEPVPPPDPVTTPQQQQQ